MSLPFYMDQHVPAAITRGLRSRGIDVLTAYEDGAAQWDDESLLERATQLARVLFTQDDDFLVLAHQWLRSGRDFAGVIYAHQQAVTIGQAIRDLEFISVALNANEMQNRIEFLPI